MSNFIKIRPVGVELFHVVERDVANSRFSQFCERDLKIIPPFREYDIYEKSTDLNFSRIDRLASSFITTLNSCSICNFHSIHFEIFSFLLPLLCCEEWLTDTRHLTIYVLDIGGPSMYERCASSTQLWTEKVTTWLHFARPWIDLCVQNMLFRDDNLPIILVFAAKIQRFPTKGGRSGRYSTGNSDRSFYRYCPPGALRFTRTSDICRILCSELEWRHCIMTDPITSSLLGWGKLDTRGLNDDKRFHPSDCCQSDILLL